MQDDKSEPPTHLTPSAEFNARAMEVSEVEIKFLVPGRNLLVFDQIRDYFDQKGWILHKNEGHQLLTRQFDTRDLSFLREGTTIRTRGSCHDGNLINVHHQDLCIKTGTTVDDSGAIRRGEYEAHTSFMQPDFNVLRNKYPADQYPELAKILQNIETSNLLEFFRIDCMRSRYLIGLPPEVTGLEDKLFVAEICMDDVVFVVDLPGLEFPWLFHRDLEVECETLFQPCKYNDTPAGIPTHSPPISEAETNKAMNIVKFHLVTAAGENGLQHNTASKARRGFDHLQKKIGLISPYIQTTPLPPETGTPATNIQPAFQVSAAATSDAALEEQAARRLVQVMKNHRVALRFSHPSL